MLPKMLTKTLLYHQESFTLPETERLRDVKEAYHNADNVMAEWLAHLLHI